MANQNNQNNPNQYGTDKQHQKDAGQQSDDKNQSMRPDDKNDRSGQQDNKDMRKSGHH